MIIRECVYEVVETDQGQALIAECVGSQKVVAIYLLDDDLDDQMEELHDAYPTVNFIPGKPTQSSGIVQALNTLDSTIKVNAVHKGDTAFGMQVYSAIQKIPKGETRSYSDIAREIGNPSAVRAVASACARNNLAYIVPCHRVIGSTGNLSGYRWGIAKKRRLLQAEGAELRFSVM
ncbi:Methylated-DNA--protein-cysteine methyltransferase [Caenorhabditis elegans]|uniref:Methylated-DNA--protein-cysteine methyltransferase n=2 Tax=Caenorhabditis elegans TaxID=6239 RepID=Q9U1Y0_CAEEL|nr:Methylated-DNA--protein-cysteine methyltransferase [Caenorhabditis elegans]CAB60594.2 Methylated-DNA--protein-cysteine methyltransferase [Caenorhabditis elegans]|eukprot:NP_001041054.1 AlkylGuanine DNA alkylTransferase [Caenorhabditis elegans]